MSQGGVGKVGEEEGGRDGGGGRGLRGIFTAPRLTAQPCKMQCATPHLVKRGRGKGEKENRERGEEERGRERRRERGEGE